jgi:DNA-binding transcriptional LysR family regulator
MSENDSASEPASMERVRRLAQLWSWLPAFRAVAELEHLPSAAERLSTSASALSRSVKLLEEQVGVPLFMRAGRRLVLNDAGRVLLDGTRDAMRLVDDALADACGGKRVGTLRVSVDAGLRHDVLVTLASVAATEPGVVVVEREAGDGSVNALLLRGELDVAVVIGVPVVDRGLSHIALGDVDYAVARKARGQKEFVRYPGEPWPEGAPRVVVLEAADAAGAALAARATGLSALVPVALHDGLVRDPTGVSVVRPAFAVIRRVLREGGLAEHFAKQLAKQLAQHLATRATKVVVASPQTTKGRPRARR